MTPAPDHRALGVALAVILLAGAHHLAAETPEPPVPLFAETVNPSSKLQLVIHAPWHRLRRQPEEDGPFPATLEMAGTDQTIELTVEKRGISRQALCDMPPIRLRFDEDELEGTLFEGNRSIKVVTHCRRGSDYEQWVLLEMLAYRLYNVLTDMSFRVRPAEITYEDSERNRNDRGRIAFLIEDDRLVGNRHGLDKVDIREIRPSDLPAVETSLFALFQYMIGNVDFSPLSSAGEECCHNAKLIGDEETLEPLFAVPYDFDGSGWVDTDYAAPPEQLPINDVRQRLFRGFCTHNDGLEPARAQIQTRRDALFEVISSEPGLSPRSRRKAGRYLDQFFEVLDDDERFELQIIQACRS